MKISSLRFILETCRDPYRNLSIEEAILYQVHEGFSPDTFRIWVNMPSLIIGSGKSSIPPNLDLHLQRGIALVRRISGGGTVYHDDGNLNWSFTIKNHDNSKGVLWVYEYYGNIIAESLRELGIQPYFVKPNRIDVNGKKISGMAGHFKLRAFLVHGTLLVNSNLQLLNSLCPMIAGAPSVTSLEELLKCKVEIETITHMILDSLKNNGITVRFGELSPGEVGLAERLHTEKYSLTMWNLGFPYDRNTLL